MVLSGLIQAVNQSIYTLTFTQNVTYQTGQDLPASPINNFIFIQFLQKIPVFNHISTAYTVVIKNLQGIL